MSTANSPAIAAPTVTCPPEHRHDTGCYNNHKCRCARCRAALAAYAREVRKQKAYGRWDQRARHDPAPVAARIAALQEYGYTYAQIARAAGVSDRSIFQVANGHLKFVFGRVAHAILALTPSLDDLDPGTLINPRGARRRLQALACAGWSFEALSRHSSIASGTLKGVSVNERITVRTHQEIAALFDELWATPAPARGRWEKRTVNVTRARAAAAGWMPALAWDDIDADDAPAVVEDAQPDDTDPIELDLVAAGVPVLLDRAQRIAAVAKLTADHSAREIAALVGCDPRTIVRDLRLIRAAGEAIAA